MSLGCLTSHIQYIILKIVNICDRQSLQNQLNQGQFFQFVPYLRTAWRNMTQSLLGEVRETLSLSLVSAVGEINKSVHAGFIYILLCEPNTLTWGNEDEWVVWVEEVREFRRWGCAGGEKEVRDGEVKELFIHKVFWWTHTGWSTLVKVRATLGDLRVF